MEYNLEEIRKRINELDKSLAELFEERMRTVFKVAEYKKLNNMNVLDRNREKDVIKRAVSYLKDQKLAPYLNLFMEDLLAISRQYQIDTIKQESIIPVAKSEGEIIANPTVGYYGSVGSYCEEAALEYFGESTEKKSYMAFEDVISALLNDDIDYGVLPIENSSTGTITAVVDLIRDNNIYIVGEFISKICHHLLAVPGTKLADINTVYSHPQGLDQSSHFLKQRQWEQIAYKSTASSAELISKLGDKTKAAIASERCAWLYGLEILVRDIQYNQNNYTRFIIIGKKLVLNDQCNKISIVMDIAHRPGALYKVLRLFSERNLNLLKIESRPIIEKPWEYLFFFDFEGNLKEGRVINLLECLKESSQNFRVLGNYKSYKDLSAI